MTPSWINPARVAGAGAEPCATSAAAFQADRHLIVIRRDPPEELAKILGLAEIAVDRGKRI
jgi:hypothetical protein